MLEHRDDVELIAKTLIQHENITADQIDYLLKNRELPPEDQYLIESKKGETPLNSNNCFCKPAYKSEHMVGQRQFEKHLYRFTRFN